MLPVEGGECKTPPGVLTATKLCDSEVSNLKRVLPEKGIPRLRVAGPAGIRLTASAGEPDLA